MVNIIGFPFSPSFNFPIAPTSSGIFVGPSITLAFFDESLFDKCVKIWIKPTVMDFILVILSKFVLDREPVGVVKSGNYVQQVSLETSEIVHVLIHISKFEILLV